METTIDNISQQPFADHLKEHGGKVFLVGGAVRDHYLNASSKDIDILVQNIPNARLVNILKSFGKVDFVGQSFGVIKFTPSNTSQTIDVALPRTERPMTQQERTQFYEVNGKFPTGHQAFVATSDHKLPIRADLQRRDFTINAIAKSIDGDIVDPFGGITDLKQGVIRMVNPRAFKDDPLRMLRAVQFAARFNFTIEPETNKQIKNNAEQITTIPGERILIELTKIVDKGNNKLGAHLFDKTGLFQQVFDTEFQRTDMEKFDRATTLGEFVFLLLKQFPNPDEMFEHKLRGDINTVKEVKALIAAHSFKDTDNVAQARQMAFDINKISPKVLHSKILPTAVKKQGNALLKGQYPLTTKHLAINGNDLLQLGLKGEEIGRAIKDALFAVFCDELPNEKVPLLTLIQQTRLKVRRSK